MLCVDGTVVEALATVRQKTYCNYLVQLVSLQYAVVNRIVYVPHYPEPWRVNVSIIEDGVPKGQASLPIQSIKGLAIGVKVSEKIVHLQELPRFVQLIL